MSAEALRPADLWTASPSLPTIPSLGTPPCCGRRANGYSPWHPNRHRGRSRMHKRPSRLSVWYFAPGRPSVPFQEYLSTHFRQGSVTSSSVRTTASPERSSEARSLWRVASPRQRLRSRYRPKLTPGCCAASAVVALAGLSATRAYGRVSISTTPPVLAGISFQSPALPPRGAAPATLVRATPIAITA